MRRPTRIALALAIAGSAATVGFGDGASLKLVDGRILEGADVELEGDFYLIEIDGSLIAVPYELVAAIRLSESAEAPAKDEAKTPPSGLREAEPEALVGPVIDPPHSEAQLRALGPQARFRKSPVTPKLAPSYWALDPDQNDFHPASWAEAPVRSDWQPVSAFDGGKNVLSTGHSAWPRSLIQPAWMPVDGFEAMRRR